MSATRCEELALAYYQAPGRELELEAIFRRWITLEGADKVFARFKEVQVLRPPGWATAYFNAWVALDEAAAMKSDYYEFHRPRALRTILSGDPAFVDQLARIQHFRQEDPLINAALPQLARERPELAKLIFTASLQDSDARARMLVSITGALAAQDPAGTLAWLNTLPADSIPDRTALTAQVFAEWVKTDPAAAKQAWEAAGKPGQRMADIMEKPENPDVQVSLALARDPFLGVQELHQALEGKEIDWSKYVRAGNLEGWHPPDPAAAAQEAAKLSPGPARDRLLHMLSNDWSYSDLAAASAFADSHGVKSSYLELLQKQPSAEMRESVMAAPEENFARLLDPALRSGNVEFDQLYDLAKEWSENDPQATAAWLASQASTEGKQAFADTFINQLFTNTVGYAWARQDPPAAIEWIEALPAGPAKSQAWAATREALNNRQQDYAFVLSAACAEGEKRAEILKSDFSGAAKKLGRAGAMELLNGTSGLSPQERATLTPLLPP